MAEYVCTPEAAGQSPTKRAGRTDDPNGISSLVSAELKGFQLSTATTARRASLERTDTQQSQSQSSRAYLSTSYSTTKAVDTRAPPHFFHDKSYQNPELFHHYHSHRQSVEMAGPSVAIRNHGVAALAEFVGTFMFLLFGFAGAQIANASPVRADDTTAPNVAVLIYISFIFGMSLMVNVFAFYRISGGQFNPVVTMALCIVGGQPLLRGVMIVVAQLVGGIAAAAVAAGMFPTPLTVETTLGPTTSTVQGLFIEMFLTAQLVFVILMLAVEKHRATFIAPIGIGFALFIIHMAGVYFTGASVNPARSLGPAVVNGHFPNYHWIYWIGPILGSLVATGFYVLLKFLHWKEVNPGQDWDGISHLEEQRSRDANEPLVTQGQV
ncbi:aquaporin [Magnaporthiopsis poae ATCC 64411]|uniref:Aquaporin n=1 Tax=Magnaporthiopsis poae (strain ATCC 64411 / 73-15) TaxID=644358 RepID=A0A0C4DMK2_MAGP6|nr:aquaporin [Magnaporthiopsis poae ATCC 64411]